MIAIRMFLQKKINIEWKDGTINVSDILLDEEQTATDLIASKAE